MFLFLFHQRHSVTKVCTGSLRNWFSLSWFISTVQCGQIMKPSQLSIKLIFHKQWISSNSRAGEQKKYPNIHLYSQRVYLVLSCMWIQSSPGKPPQSLARYSLHPQTSKSAEKEEDTIERAAISSGSDFMLYVAFPWLQKPIPLNPHFCFSIVPPFFPSMSAHNRDWRQQLAIALRRVNLHAMPRGLG